MLQCTIEKVNESLKFTCSCQRDCMRKVDKKDVLKERTFFYNEPFSKRQEYILTKIDHPGFEKGYMLFKTLEVCKPASWTIYGFVRQTFYNYEGAYKLGQRIGFHGNHGTFKPKDTSIFARTCMKTFFQQTAEPLPHKESKNENTDGIFYRLPKDYSRCRIARIVKVSGKVRELVVVRVQKRRMDTCKIFGFLEV
ncbi:hypothetical protein R1sor_000242 [Riccia sorocarpa]|uniref:Uncharacterized protein n=1 Tax=Riccia sorocarpa TaxID=122646 RepID=A0ABD3GVP8_9MARC